MDAEKFKAISTKRQRDDLGAAERYKSNIRKHAYQQLSAQIKALDKNKAVPLPAQGHKIPLLDMYLVSGPMLRAADDRRILRGKVTGNLLKQLKQAQRIVKRYTS